MNREVDLQNKRDKAIGFASALILHSVVIYCMLSFHINPSPDKAHTVYVNLVSLPSPSMQSEPVVSKPVQQKQSKTINDVPVSPEVTADKAPAQATATPEQPSPRVHAATEPVKTPVRTPVIAPARESERAGSGGPTSASIPASNSSGVHAPQPVILNSELSVSCPDRKAPAYPRQSTRLGEQGKTVLLVELDELGQVVDVTIKIKSGFSRLDEAAVNTVKTWRCTPAKRNGIAVRSVALQPFNFTLKGR